jgi:hypothetical protein
LSNAIFSRLLALSFFCCFGFQLVACDNMTATDEDPNDNAPQPADHRVTVGPAPENGVQFVMPETVIAAGEERMICWIPDWVPETDYFVEQFEGLQSALGHHVVALTSGIPRNAGDVFDCTDIESMTTISPLILPDLETEPLLPDGFAVKLPQDAKIVIQSHYVNYAEEDILVADVARFHFTAENSEPTIASYWIANHGGLQLEPGEDSATVTCDIESEMKLIVLLGHMHDLGVKVSMTRTTAEGVVDTIYSVDNWTIEYRDLPPLVRFSPEDPLIFNAGDTVSITCHYNNPTEDIVTFPQEMCTAVGYYFPALPDGIVMCD